ncbi:hypothetical protein FI667_g6894, partial [Globisporangium splendens]
MSANKGSSASNNDCKSRSESTASVRLSVQAYKTPHAAKYAASNSTSSAADDVRMCDSGADAACAVSNELEEKELPKIERFPSSFQDEHGVDRVDYEESDISSLFDGDSAYGGSSSDEKKNDNGCDDSRESLKKKQKTEAASLSSILDPHNRGASRPEYDHASFETQALKDDTYVQSLNLDPITDDRNRFYIDLFFQMRYCVSRKRVRKNSYNTAALLQSWNTFIDNFNKCPKVFVDRLRAARKRYVKHSIGGRVEAIRFASLANGIPCGVPTDTHCPIYPNGAEWISHDDLNRYGDNLVPNTVKDMTDAFDALRSNANSNERHGRSDESEPRASDSRTLAPSQARPVQAAALAPMSRSWKGNQASVPSTRYARYARVGDPCGQASARQSSACYQNYQLPVPAVGETPAVQQNAVGQSVAEMHNVILRHESRLQELARLVDDLREENRGLLKCQLTLQNHFDKLQSDYKGLLCDLNHHQIHRGDARRHREANGKATADLRIT